MSFDLSSGEGAAPAAWSTPPASARDAAWDSPRFAPTKIAAVVESVAESGVASAAVLAGTGLRAAQLQDPDTQTSTSQLYRVVRQARQLDPAPDLAWRIGRRLRISSYGMYGYALLCAPTMRAALDFATRYHLLANPLVPIRAEESGTALAWIFPARRELDLPDLSDPVYRLLIEMQMAIHHTLTLDVLGPDARPVQARFGWPAAPGGAGGAPAGPALGCPVLHGQPRSELHYPRAWLDRRPQLANPLTAAQISRTCARLLQSLEGASSLAGRVYRELMAKPGEFPGIESIAARLGMTGRTLRRHLQAEATSYAELLARVRRALAEDYLSGTRMSVEDIAGALAFSNARSFRQAFVRWTGRAPTEFRRGA